MNRGIIVPVLLVAFVFCNIALIARADPPVPSSLTATAHPEGIFLRWSYDPTISGYEIYRDGDYLSSTIFNDFFDEEWLDPGREYTYSVYSYDGEYVYSPEAATVRVRSLPAAPAPLFAVPTPSGAVNLTWQISTGTAYYKIYRDGALRGSSIIPSFTDTQTTPNTEYAFSVAAFNSAGVSRNPAFNVYVLTAPASPVSLVGGPLSATSIHLHWNSSLGAEGYIVYRDGQQITTTSQVNFTDTGLAQTGTYSYSVAAYNVNNTSSLPCAPITVRPQQDPPPPTPFNFSVSAASIRVVLNWSITPGATGYIVYRNGAQLITTTSNHFADIGVIPQTAYQYSIVAYNAQGVQSAPTVIISVTTGIYDPNGDDDGDGIPNNVEFVLGTSAVITDQIDSSNNTHFKVYKPAL